MKLLSTVRLICVVCIIFFLPHVAGAMEVKHTAEFSESDLIFSTLMGYDVVQIRDGNIINDIGKPMMPGKEIKIALPFGMKVKGIRIIDIQNRPIKGEYTIFPAQSPRRIGDVDDDVVFVEPDAEAYSSMEYYPSIQVDFVHQTDLTGQAMAVIHLFPVQYIPRIKKLMLNTKISFVIEGEGGYEYGSYLSSALSDANREDYEMMIKDMVINPEDVYLITDSKGRTDSRNLPSGSYHYVIITQSNWEDDFQPLADWKTKKGVPTRIVTLDDITTWYGDDTPVEIRSFINDAYYDWGTIYFLLGGDTNVIPYYTRTIEGDAIPNDTYYADLGGSAGNWSCDVHVGRASVRSTYAISTFINKILTYEKNPPLSNYAKTAALFGFDLNSAGTGEGENCKREIDWDYIPSGWTVRREYDSEPGGHHADVISYLNQGNNLVNHIDHATTYTMGTGSTNHNSWLTTSQVNGLLNGDRLSIIYSIGCWACAYDYNNCIAEHFVRNGNGGGSGGIAFIGNSRFGWYYPGCTDALSLLYDKYFFQSLFIHNYNNIYKLGNCFSDHKNDGPKVSDREKYIFIELTLLGDPELPIWTENPTTIDNVGYVNPIINTGTQDFTVTVTDGGSPVSGALICVQKEGEVYDYGTTFVNGQLTFTINPITEGIMDVTVTARNLLPWEGTAIVTEFLEYILNVNVDGGGSVIKDPDSLTYPPDTPVELTAIADSGWVFDHWSGDADGSDNPKTITIYGNTDITAHFIDGHILDLTYFPMRDALSPFDEYSGAAVAQMTLDYIWWNRYIYPEPYPEPPVKYTQSELYTYGLDYSDADPYFDFKGMWHTVQDKKPMPYTQYGYNFNRQHNFDQNTMLKQICQWIDYTVGTFGGHEDGHPYHVPAIVPTFGHYGNWMAVRGIHTDVEAYPMPPELTIYAFWVNDPTADGIGENTYKKIDTWNSIYYVAMMTGDYTGEYIGVFDPPEATDGCQLMIVEPIPRFTPVQINQLVDIDGQTILQNDQSQLIVDAAIAGVTEELIPYDRNFEAVFAKTIPGLPMYVTSFDSDNYYIIPFNTGRLKKKVRNQNVPADAETRVVILINAEDGSFKEASWTSKVVKYLPISKEEARQTVFDTAEKMGLEVEEINSLKPELVHRQASPYYPEWLVIIGEYAICVSQDGAVLVEDYSGLGSYPNGSMSGDTGKSFTYALNTATPTPFINNTTISYSIARRGHVSFNIYDACGRLVKTLVNTHKDAGFYSLQWDGYDNNNCKVGPGVYFTRLASGEFVSVKKIILAK